jgi:hypothetical protein
MTNRKSVSAQSLSANPFGVTTKRKGRGRPQPNSSFVASENSIQRLTREEMARARDFYQSSRIQEIQFMRMAREWGC